VIPNIGIWVHSPTLTCERCGTPLKRGKPRFGPAEIVCGNCGIVRKTSLTSWTNLSPVEKVFAALGEVVAPSLWQPFGNVLMLNFFRLLIYASLLALVLYALQAAISEASPAAANVLEGIMVGLFAIGMISRPVYRLICLIKESNEYSRTSVPPVWKGGRRLPPSEHHYPERQDSPKASVTVQDQANYFQDNPPRCIKEFKTEPVSLGGVEFDGHPSLEVSLNPVVNRKIHTPVNINTVFRLRCGCGHTKAYILGRYRPIPKEYHQAFGPFFFDAPLALRCEFCNTVTELFDARTHGYNGEMGLSSIRSGNTETGKDRESGERTEFKCEKCGPVPIEAIVRFEYPDDLFDEGLCAFAGREQDLFTWFSVVGRCSRCGQLIEVTDFECA
jgi:hypothetical protein